jgi:Cu/Zn superoxide dismutase
MGFNSVLFVCNDALGTVDREPEKFAELISRKMGGLDTGEFGFGGHANGFCIPHIGHADEQVVLLVGGNRATKLASHRNWRAGHDEEGQLEALKVLAHKLGYTIRKKPKKEK